MDVMFIKENVDDNFNIKNWLVCKVSIVEKEAEECTIIVCHFRMCAALL